VRPRRQRVKKVQCVARAGGPILGTGEPAVLRSGAFEDASGLSADRAMIDDATSRVWARVVEPRHHVREPAHFREDGIAALRRPVALTLIKNLIFSHRGAQRASSTTQTSPLIHNI